MIETWIDELAKVWQMNDGGFGNVRSYLLIGKAEFPASIDPKDLATQPIALTIPGSLAPEYSTGGPLFGIWSGVTEFHVAPDIDRGRLPALLPWYGRILRAAVGHLKLNNTVELFMIEKREDAITGPLALQYGDEQLHWGFLVHWTVKERLEDQLTVSA